MTAKRENGDDGEIPFTAPGILGNSHFIDPGGPAIRPHALTPDSRIACKQAPTFQPRAASQARRLAWQRSFCAAVPTVMRT
jgi:hypothetical protein